VLASVEGQPLDVGVSPAISGKPLTDGVLPCGVTSILALCVAAER